MEEINIERYLLHYSLPRIVAMAIVIIIAECITFNIHDWSNTEPNVTSMLACSIILLAGFCVSIGTILGLCLATRCFNDYIKNGRLIIDEPIENIIGK